MGRHSSEDKLIRQLRSDDEKKALSRMAEIAESGGVLTTTKDLQDVLIALRLSGKKINSEIIHQELEVAGWITEVDGKIVVKKPIPLITLGQIIKK